MRKWHKPIPTWFRAAAIATAAAALLGFSWIVSPLVAQTVPGAIRITSLVGSFGIDTITTGPQKAWLPVTGGTATVCTGGGTITVANTAVDAGSIILLSLKTAGGTVAQPFVATTTAGTGFTFTCGGSDTSIYYYLIIG